MILSWPGFVVGETGVKNGTPKDFMLNANEQIIVKPTDNP